MKEKDRVKRLMILIQKLHQEKKNDIESLELLKQLVDNDSHSMKKTFEIMLKPTPLSFLLGVDKLADLDNLDR